MISSKVEDLTMSFKYYSGGDNQSVEGYAAGYILLSDSNKQCIIKDKRFASAEIICGDKTRVIQPESLTNYESGWGLTSLFPPNP